ncbi:Putative 4-hydroxy-tetrahydrodipicolinate reductase 3, chloroplastic [Apostasia shenzhenica]|uniref:4-hydroxy-tetrahydrodipicolinate reductase 3, chloroplastic n=1 Tax=Apostasia shenzhenica TaxID=1088818 RepID=A0A2H9ZTD5_9ASPA|nr:Putative 4-hydroxy-tetrahydrodipicolinate reductase 3, chloroplastic [Apostasia shenzhenica]
MNWGRWRGREGNDSQKYQLTKFRQKFKDPIQFPLVITETREDKGYYPHRKREGDKSKSPLSSNPLHQRDKARMVSLSYQPHLFQGKHRIIPAVSCTSQASQSNIKVVVNGAAKNIGRAAILAVSRARGMEIAGAVDSSFVGEDAGKVSGMDEPLEVPILNDLTMVLGSIAQSKATGVIVDFTEPSTVFDNVKQAAAFGLNSVVYVPKIELETISALSAFCEKASMGCLVAPTLSVGSVLLQQAAITASFYYDNVEIVESKPTPYDLPPTEAKQIATNLTNLGQLYNREDISTDNPVSSGIPEKRILYLKARGQVLGEDGIRVHSMVLPGLPSSTTVHFSADRVCRLMLRGTGSCGIGHGRRPAKRKPGATRRRIAAFENPYATTMARTHGGPCDLPASSGVQRGREPAAEEEKT